MTLDWTFCFNLWLKILLQLTLADMSLALVTLNPQTSQCEFGASVEIEMKQNLNLPENMCGKFESREPIFSFQTFDFFFGHLKFCMFFLLKITWYIFLNSPQIVCLRLSTGFLGQATTPHELDFPSLFQCDTLLRGCRYGQTKLLSVF